MYYYCSICIITLYHVFYYMLVKILQISTVSMECSPWLQFTCKHVDFLKRQLRQIASISPSKFFVQKALSRTNSIDQRMLLDEFFWENKRTHTHTGRVLVQIHMPGTVGLLK